MVVRFGRSLIRWRRSQSSKKFRSRQQSLSQPLAGFYVALQSGRQDSNLRLRGPKPRALAKLSYAPRKTAARRRSVKAPPEERLQRHCPHLAFFEAAYLEAIASGQTPDRKHLLAAHPDLADDLRAFFADHDQMTQAAAPVRAVLEDDCRRTGSLACPVPAETFPEPFGDYELLEEIGRGGMGVVYKARQISLNRIVALKRIRAGQLASDDRSVTWRSLASASQRSMRVGIFLRATVRPPKFNFRPSLTTVKTSDVMENQNGKSLADAGWSGAQQREVVMKLAKCMRLQPGPRRLVAHHFVIAGFPDRSGVATENLCVVLGEISQ